MDFTFDLYSIFIPQNIYAANNIEPVITEETD